MPAFILEKCCCCWDLKAGSIVYGYINAVLSLVFTVLAGIGVITGAAFAIDGSPKHHGAGIALAVLFGVFLIIFALVFVFSVILIVGLHKNKPGLVKGYLIVDVIFNVASWADLIAKCVLGVATSVHIVFTIVFLILDSYFFFVIRSVYYQLKDPLRGAVIYSTV